MDAAIGLTFALMKDLSAPELSTLSQKVRPDSLLQHPVLRQIIRRLQQRLAPGRIVHRGRLEHQPLGGESGELERGLATPSSCRRGSAAASSGLAIAPRTQSSKAPAMLAGYAGVRFSASLRSAMPK